MAIEKTVVFHDYFAIRGGGERLALVLADALGARLVYGYRTGESYEDAAFPSDTLSLDLPPALRRPGLRPLALAALFSARRKLAADHAVRIFSGVAAPFAAPARAAPGLSVFYCHTPPRFLFDQRAHFEEKFGAGAAGRLLLDRFEAAYRRAVDRMDVIVTNSKTTQERIDRYLGHQSRIIHPPIQTNRFQYRDHRGYYLSTARLTPLKRVDQIIDAFLEMPDKNLVVASGGEDLEALKIRAAGAPNISFRGWVSDAELVDLVGKSIATLYLPVDEDFGMSPVESMAAGKPVIGVAAGGLRETIEHEKTGLLLPPDFSVPDLRDAIRAMTPTRAAAMRDACQARALEFTEERFISEMQRVIAEARSVAS